MAEQFLTTNTQTTDNISLKSGDTCVAINNGVIQAVFNGESFDIYPKKVVFVEGESYTLPKTIADYEVFIDKAADVSLVINEPVRAGQILRIYYHPADGDDGHSMTMRVPEGSSTLIRYFDHTKALLSNRVEVYSGQIQNEQIYEYTQYVVCVSYNPDPNTPNVFNWRLYVNGLEDAGIYPKS